MIQILALEARRAAIRKPAIRRTLVPHLRRSSLLDDSDHALTDVATKYRPYGPGNWLRLK
jgi:hypothetical protein